METGPMMFEQFQFPKEAEGILRNMQGLLQKGTRLADLFSLTQEEMDGTYAMAAKMLAAGQVREARVIFTLLTVLDHKSARYWRGLGICTQHEEDYNAALPMYSMALMVDPDDVISYVFRAECYLEKNQRVSAAQDVERAIEKGSTQPKMYAYVKRAERLQMRINTIED